MLSNRDIRQKAPSQLNLWMLPDNDGEKRKEERKEDQKSLPSDEIQAYSLSWSFNKIQYKRLSNGTMYL